MLAWWNVWIYECIQSMRTLISDSVAFVFQHRTSVMKQCNVAAPLEEFSILKFCSSTRWCSFEFVGIIRACKIVERCSCVNFPTVIMTWLKEYLNNCSKNALTVNALCVLGISLPQFHYQECKSELNIHTLPESCACTSLFLGSVCHLPGVGTYTWNKVCWFSPTLPFAAL